jgi:hypothetical protein
MQQRDDVVKSAMGVPIRRRSREQSGRYVDMVDRNGNISPVWVDIHDALREDAFKIAGKLVVGEFITDNPSDPTLTMSVYDGVNRVFDGPSRPATKTVHVRPELIAEMDRRRSGYLADLDAVTKLGPAERAKEEQRRIAEDAAQSAIASIVGAAAKQASAVVQLPAKVQEAEPATTPTPKVRRGDG